MVKFCQIMQIAVVLVLFVFEFSKSYAVFYFVKSILKSLVILAIWLALSSGIYFQIAPFSALSRIYCSSNENGTVKQNNQLDFKVSLN